MDDVIKFTTPDPVDGPPRPFDLEVIHVTREKVTDRPDDAPEDWQPHEVEHKERRVHHFHAVPALSGGILVQIDLMVANQRPGQQGGSHARGGDALFDFLEGMLVPEDRERFMSLIHDPDVYVHHAVLSQIALHFYRLYTGLPTTPLVS